MRAALDDGKAAAVAAQPPDANPYTGDPSPKGSVLATLWRTGYQAGNPMPVLDDTDNADTDD
jgi:hypothetical protein